MIKISKDKRIVLKKWKSGRGYRYLLECLYCHKPFESTGMIFNKSGGRFCCLKHYWKYMKGKPTISSTKFKKGIIPWSKNQKGIHLSPDTEFKSGLLHPKWKPEGYQYLANDTGYKMIKCTGHLRANKRGYVFRANLVTEFCLGRKLLKNECVHHINLIRDDDSPSNLYLFPTKKAHSTYHLKLYRKLVPKITQSNFPTIVESSLPDNLQC